MITIVIMVAGSKGFLRVFIAGKHKSDMVVGNGIVFCGVVLITIVVC
jgi:hypothetical protein